MIMSASDIALKAPNQSVAAENAWLMARHLSDARVRIYPDSGHGFLFQWPEQFAELVHRFLSGPGEDWAA
jgi:pimeloyl-ACP methyl ester carboxylesterase